MFIRVLLVSLFLSSLSAEVFSADTSYISNVNFIHYDAKLAPDLANKTIGGEVSISFSPQHQPLSELSFSAKYKTIASVSLNGAPVSFEIEKDTLNIAFSKPLKVGERYTLNVSYQASPKKGAKFYADHMFTVYHTNYWLVAHKDISDKASFELTLTHPSSMTSVGNGHLLSQQSIGNNRTISKWQQKTPMPTYTFGFALGRFQEITFDTATSEISVFYREDEDLTKEHIRRAFANLTDINSFLEEKAGFGLTSQYRFVVVEGSMAQEASNFSMVGEKFVHTLLKNKYENWFITHELAHEWWGNSITSSNFSHFWLNEGLVVFIVAAYKQHLFGDTAYYNELQVALNRVEKAVQQNRIAPVAFKSVIAEKDINHTMAYSKGALVFYLLREQLGDTLFWQALKHYSVQYQGKSVTTQDLKKVFEQVSNQDLTEFFDKWVYGNEIPHITFKNKYNKAR